MINGFTVNKQQNRDGIRIGSPIQDSWLYDKSKEYRIRGLLLVVKNTNINLDRDRDPKGLANMGEAPHVHGSRGVLPT